MPDRGRIARNLGLDVGSKARDGDPAVGARTGPSSAHCPDTDPLFLSFSSIIVGPRDNRTGPQSHAREKVSLL